MSTPAQRPESSAATPPGGEDVPRRLRDAREQAGLSLRQLAKRLDLSASALSQIETGKSRPSVRTLYAVVSELGLSLDELFATTPADAAAVPPTASAAGAPREGGGTATVVRRSEASGDPVVRPGGRATLELGAGVTWARLTAAHDPMVDFLQVSYAPGATSNAEGALVRHAGREYGIVLSGRLEVTVGFETYALEAGDSISFSSYEPHLLANRSDEPAEGIWLVIGRRESDPRDPAFEPSPPEA